jgi:hypothetical protein
MRLTPKRVLAGQTVLFVLYFLMAIPSPAYAHPDYRIANDTLTIAPGRVCGLSADRALSQGRRQF